MFVFSKIGINLLLTTYPILQSDTPGKKYALYFLTQLVICINNYGWQALNLLPWFR